MKPYYKVIFLVFLLPVVHSGPRNFKPGYVVSLKGDTTKGLVDYQAWLRNPRTIDFKPAMDRQPNHYTAKQIKGFGINGMQYFESYALAVSMDAIDVNSAPHSIDTTNVVDTVYIHLLFKGDKLSLYNYNDAIKERLYIKKQGNNRLEELVYHVYTEVEHPGEINKINSYRMQLRSIAIADGIDDRKLTRRILMAEYDEHDVLKIIEIINAESKI